jgi:hypothetical protein
MTIPTEEYIVGDSGAAPNASKMPLPGMTDFRTSQSTLSFGNNTRLPVGTTANLGEFRFSIVKDIAENIASLGSLADKGYISIIDSGRIVVLHRHALQNFQLKKSMIRAAFDRSSDGLYRMKLNDFASAFGPQTNPQTDNGSV